MSSTGGRDPRDGDRPSNNRRGSPLTAASSWFKRMSSLRRSRDTVHLARQQSHRQTRSRNNSSPRFESGGIHSGSEDSSRIAEVALAVEPDLPSPRLEEATSTIPFFDDSHVYSIEQSGGEVTLQLSVVEPVAEPVPLPEIDAHHQSSLPHISSVETPDLTQLSLSGHHHASNSDNMESRITQFQDATTTPNIAESRSTPQMQGESSLPSIRHLSSHSHPQPPSDSQSSFPIQSPSPSFMAQPSEPRLRNPSLYTPTRPTPIYMPRLPTETNIPATHVRSSQHRRNAVDFTAALDILDTTAQLMHDVPHSGGEDLEARGEWVPENPWEAYRRRGGDDRNWRRRGQLSVAPDVPGGSDAGRVENLASLLEVWSQAQAERWTARERLGRGGSALENIDTSTNTFGAGLRGLLESYRGLENIRLTREESSISPDIVDSVAASVRDAMSRVARFSSMMTPLLTLQQQTEANINDDMDTIPAVPATVIARRDSQDNIVGARNIVFPEMSRQNANSGQSSPNRRIYFDDMRRSRVQPTGNGQGAIISSENQPSRVSTASTARPAPQLPLPTHQQPASRQNSESEPAALHLTSSDTHSSSSAASFQIFPGRVMPTASPARGVDPLDPVALFEHYINAHIDQAVLDSEEKHLASNNTTNPSNSNPANSSQTGTTNPLHRHPTDLPTTFHPTTRHPSSLTVPTITIPLHHTLHSATSRTEPHTQTAYIPTQAASARASAYRRETAAAAAQMYAQARSGTGLARMLDANGAPVAPARWEHVDLVMRMLCSGGVGGERIIRGVQRRGGEEEGEGQGRNLRRRVRGGGVHVTVEGGEEWIAGVADAGSLTSFAGYQNRVDTEWGFP
ncbi:hypothetical protein BC830DRAFT_255557 [Chytriomyces sp. MP71]|nr:hypothetical protein BC830DRAFT_255557 [Chytriomyces sp. MP71]